LAQLNDIVRQDFPQGSFVTMIYGILDTRAGTLTLSNAGHPYPLVAGPSWHEFLQIPDGLPLGIQSSSFGERAVELSSGTSVLLCSDGVLEAENSAGQEFGMERLKESISYKTATADNLLAIVQAFASPKVLMDDATVLIVRRE
jgi:sigma-B regulation protein RsbU (phosphoserine phosphatase)